MGKKGTKEPTGWYDYPADDRPVVSSACAADGDAPSIIIGPGRIGGLLSDLGCDEDIFMSRGENFPQPLHELARTREDITGIGHKQGHKATQAFPTGPIYVAMGLHNLREIIEIVPIERHEDLVFVQDGYIDDFLGENGLGEATRAVLYFSIAQPGDTPVDGGWSVAHGKWANALQAESFRSLRVQCPFVLAGRCRVQHAALSMREPPLLLCSAAGAAGQRLAPR